MQIYLIRHAHALAGENDAARPVSRKGRKQIKRIAAFLNANDILATHEFWHSPLVRSRVTAERLVKELRIRAKLRLVDGLLHEDEPAIMARRLNAVKRPVAVVGHEPHLSALASLLVAGKPHPSLFVLKKGAVLALEKHKGRWAVRWQASPEIV